MIEATEEYRDDRLRLAKERRGLKKKNAVPRTRKGCLELDSNHSMTSHLAQDSSSYVSYREDSNRSLLALNCSSAHQIAPATLGRSSSDESAASHTHKGGHHHHHQHTRRSRGLRRGRTRPEQSPFPVPQTPITADIMAMDEQEMLELALRLSTQEALN